jgi:hypothetical protein
VDLLALVTEPPVQHRKAPSRSVADAIKHVHSSSSHDFAAGERYEELDPTGRALGHAVIAIVDCTGRI